MAMPSPATGNERVDVAPWSVVVAIDRSGTMTLRLRGEIDTDAAPTLDRALAWLRHVDRDVPAFPVASRRLAIDCSEITFMDVRGLGCLLRHGRYVRLVNPSRHVRRLIESL